MSKEDKKEYSLRELVPDITDLNYEQSITTYSFDADYKRLQRIYNTLRKLGSKGSQEAYGIDYKRETIYEYEKEAIVGSLKAVFNDDKKYRFINKLNKPEGFNSYNFNEEEIEMFIDIFYIPFEDLEDKDFSLVKEDIRNYIYNIFNMETNNRLVDLKATTSKVLDYISHIDSSKYRNTLMDQIDEKVKEIIGIVLHYSFKQTFLDEIKSQNIENANEIRYKVEIEELPNELVKEFYSQMEKELDELKE